MRLIKVTASVLAMLLWSSVGGAETYELQVEGFACELCARSLQSRLSGLENVEEVSASFEESKAIVRTKDGVKLTEEVFRDVVEGAGFKLTGYRELRER